MNSLLQGLQTKDALTLNGAVTNSTSLNNCLDLFFLAGACRSESEKNIVSKLEKAYQEDKVKCLQVVFWAGDIRQGAGERRFFKIALRWLNDSHKNDFYKIFDLVPEFNRWDSLFDIISTSEYRDAVLLDFIRDSLLQKKDGLLAKWLPRGKQYNNLSSLIRSYYKWSPKFYRKTIVELTKVVEQQMSKKQWSEIKYEHVPSVASNKYRKAFYRNDEERFTKFIEDCKLGKKTINASAIFPYDIYRALRRGDDKNAIDVQWNSLPNYLEGKNFRFLPMCDVSESMNGLPMDISVSLGLYLSERNNSSFKNAFITFTSIPSIQITKGSLSERANQIEGAVGYNTNLQAAFDALLNVAVRDNISLEDMPTHILVISDMEFDNSSISGKSNFEVIKSKFQRANYKLPKLVFWNVNGRVSNVPVNIKDENVVLVSGSSPSVIKLVLEGDIYPESAMNKIIESERYKIIKERISS